MYCSAVAQLSRKFLDLDIDTLSLPAYNQTYLRQKLARLQGSLRICQHYLQIASVRPDSTVLCYGDGHGFMAMLAAELGCTVIYNDVNPDMAKHARTLSACVGLGFDHVVVGDIRAVVECLCANQISVDAVVSHNCLEHIYDVPDFLNSLADIPGEQLRVAIGSAANSHNPHLRRKLMKHHRRRETEFVEIRREMIADYAPGLPLASTNMLAACTRGLAEADIYATVDAYQNGMDTPIPTHPTNTCDPRNGNRTENLMDIYGMRDTLACVGFRAEVQAGRYVPQMSHLYDVIGPVLNTVIAVLGTRALALAPYYVLCGERHPVRLPQISTLST